MEEIQVVNGGDIWGNRIQFFIYEDEPVHSSIFKDMPYPFLCSLNIYMMKYQGIEFSLECSCCKLAVFLVPVGRNLAKDCMTLDLTTKLNASAHGLWAL